jgi:methylated-DNA-[protein]-cysteine S-methyltransferase
MKYFFKEMNSSVGRIRLVAGENGLAAILWEDDKPKRVRVREFTRDDEHPVLLRAEQQLREYFGGQRKEFSIELDPIGTDFQKRVWNALSAIPYGETRTYRDIARQIGDQKATRAVGAANGRNPIAIIVPCHRVVGSSGELTGFAGGLDAKVCLLSLEGVDVRNNKAVTNQLDLALVG